MAEFKFSCPQCNQHIQCDTGYAGMQINCPTCQQAIVVPQAPRSAAAPALAMAPPPPPPPSASAPGLATRQTTAAPSTGRRFAGAPNPTGAPPPKPKSKVLKTALVITAVLVVLAGLGAGGWFGFSKYKEHKAAKKANPAAQVTAPTADAAIQALSILVKVHSAYTNLTSVRADGTFTMSLDVSNITMADVNPQMPADSKNANRHPQGMPRMITDATEFSVKRAQPAFYCIVAESVAKIDRQTVSNTFAIWKSDKGQFTFSDNHQKMQPPTYQQLADNTVTNADADQFKKMQQLFEDPANLTKIIKDLGQTDDESVNGQDCYTLTAKVIGQKVKVWVDKTTYLIPQWQITLGGAISDADVDDAFSLYASGFTNLPPAALDMIKTQVKKYTPVMTKIRGTITSTTKNVEMNPTLSPDDFNYDVPRGVRLIRQAVPGGNMATARARSQQNACINNLRQIDAAKNEWALEKGKPNGTAVTEADIKPYIKLDASGNLPKCPAGGTYTIGKVGEKPTCSIPGHALQ
jgi:outer membrane lipoprotein-sorting protein